jgi:hypothetical protein
VQRDIKRALGYLCGLMLIGPVTSMATKPKPLTLCVSQSKALTHSKKCGDEAPSPDESTAAHSGEVLFQRQFEGSDPMEGLAFTSRTKLADGSYNYPTLSTAHAREGNKSLRIHLDYDWGWDRAEYRVHPLSGQSGSAIEPFYYKTDNVPWDNCEVYIGFSVYLPSSWTDVSGGSIIFQIHEYNAPSGPSNPAFAIAAKETGRFEATSRWHPKGRTRSQVSYDLGPIVRDQWVDFQIRIKLALTAAAGGLTIRRRDPSSTSTFTEYAHFDGTRGTMYEPYTAADGTKVYEWGVEYKFGQYKWIYWKDDYAPAAGEQTVWEHWQDSHVVSKCNAGNWDMVTPSGQGF